ncbi:hypothetical protein Sjap_003141 [Stephania japonica]|uniref:Endoplasmic reticulum transmembrane protein n=1 Tax=Stephania japonica TaxID=461633 RepID=A0AAP0KN60_9MAGN
MKESGERDRTVRKRRRSGGGELERIVCSRDRGVEESLRGRSDPAIPLQDSIKEARDHWPGQGEARERPSGGEDGGGDGLHSSSLERLQHGQDPEPFDRGRWVVNPTDQVLMARHLLEASLMGFSLFLALMIDRLHHYIRELRLLRKSMEAIKKQSRGFEDGKSGNSEETKGSEVEINGLMSKVKQLESDIKKKEKEVENAEASISALKKQSEGLLMEYDRLQADNQNLRNQLQSIDQQLPHSDNKKSS